MTAGLDHELLRLHTWVVHGVGLGHSGLHLLAGVTTTAGHRLESSGYAVGGEVLGLHHVPRVNVLAQLGAEAALLHVVKVDQGEED